MYGRVSASVSSMVMRRYEAAWGWQVPFHDASWHVLETMSGRFEDAVADLAAVGVLSTQEMFLSS